ncbi:MerR family transcriptional regulator [Paenibacillus kribbensis]|nr:MerR family transcriptional regulator [Paenibacillus kribbensis]
MMKKNSETYFTTGQFAKICKVNKRTLFHYDEIGLFQPAFIDENGYRYYSYHQFDLFSIITVLKELNVPLKEIKTYLDERTPERILDLSKHKISEVNKEIDKMIKIKHILEETIVYTHKGLNSTSSEIKLEEHEEERIIRSTSLEENNINDYAEWMMNFKKFEHSTQSVGASFVGSMLDKEAILAGKYASKSYLFVKTNNRNNTHFSNFIKPKGLYAVAYHHGSYEKIGRTYERLIQYIEKENFLIQEFAYEEYLIDEVGAKDESEYVTQITVRLKSKNL